MDKSTVTRTFSIGGICSATKTKEDFSAERRHSSAGIRALLWATSSAKSLGCSLGSDSQTSWENIYPNILTPDSIPQFTIPSLSVQSSLRSVGKEEEDAEPEEGLGNSLTESSIPSSVSSPFSSSSSSTGMSWVQTERKAERSISDPLNQRKSLQREGSYPFFQAEAQHCLDPASRAALSLPHLTKVTTPYGFITLSQSPQMVSEEALLCQTGQRRFNKEEETTCSLSKATGTRTVDDKSSCAHSSGNKKKLSKGSTDSQNKDVMIKEEMKASSVNLVDATVSTSSTKKQQDSKRKRHFRSVIRKHFLSRHID